MLYFFFKDTATTEIYTYGHTLSRHDALPISLRGVARRFALSRRGVSAASGLLAWGVADDLLGRRHAWPEQRSQGFEQRRRLHLARSEEHTSELQSLMRISYAVFCLKKK